MCTSKNVHLIATHRFATWLMPVDAHEAHETFQIATSLRWSSDYWSFALWGKIVNGDFLWDNIFSNDWTSKRCAPHHYPLGGHSGAVICLLCAISAKLLSMLYSLITEVRNEQNLGSHTRKMSPEKNPGNFRDATGGYVKCLETHPAWKKQQLKWFRASNFSANYGPIQHFSGKIAFSAWNFR